MYLPRLEDDEVTVLCNAVEFDGIALIRNDERLSLLTSSHRKSYDYSCLPRC